MKILIITDYYYRISHIGGGDIIARQFKDGLVKDDHKVYVACCKGNNFKTLNDNTVKRIFNNNKSLDKTNIYRFFVEILFEKIKLLFLIKSLKPDVIFGLQMDGLTVPTISLINSLKLPKVYRLGSEWVRIYFENRVMNWQKFLDKYINNVYKRTIFKLLGIINDNFYVSILSKSYIQAECIIFNSNYLIERNMKVLDSNTKKIVIRNGIDFNFFKPLNKKVLDHSIKLLFVGRLSKQKGINILLDAISLLSKTQEDRRDITLTIVGWTDKEDQINKVYNLIDKHKLTDTVNLLKTIQYEDIPKLYVDHDIFIFPSIERSSEKSHEGCPSVILEALATGIPIVARLQPGIDEILQDGYNCVAYFDDDPLLLSDAIIKLISNSQLYADLRQNGIKYVKDNHDLVDTITGVNDVLIKSANYIS